MGKKKSRLDRRKYEAIGVALFGLGIFAFFSIYTNGTGVFGKYFREVLMGLLGIFSYVMPVIILGIGAVVLVSSYKSITKSKFILSIISFIFILYLIHIFHLDYYDSDSMLKFVSSSYLYGLKGKGAGALLSPFVYILYKLLGVIGSCIFLMVVFVINLIILTNLSFENGIKLISDKSSDLIGSIKNMRKRPFTESNIKFDDEDMVTEVKMVDDCIEIDETDQKHESLTANLKSKLKVFELEQEEKLENEPKQIFEDIAKENTSPSEEYTFPALTLLDEPEPNKKQIQSSNKYIIDNAKVLEETLENFGVNAKVSQASRGPVITRYEVQPAPGVKVSKIVNLADDIALNLASSGLRIEAPIPGKAAVGIEVPNKNTSPVLLSEVIKSKKFNNHPSKISFALGKDITGSDIIADIAKMPHLLIAGATGSGKSVCINTIIISLLYRTSPEEVRLVLIDPKVVELNNYNGIPHLLFPVVTDPKKAAGALNWIVQEMEERYKSFADAGVRDLERYNDVQAKLGEEKLPQIVVIIDELSDLMMIAPNEVEDSICRLAQMARAAGIHLIIATQRPSVDVITGLIKANIPSRIAFAVSSSVDSRTILDMSGAEKLLGRGDMLYYPVGAHKPMRVQGAFVSEKEVENIVDFVKAQEIETEYDEEAMEEIETLDRELDNDASEVDELFGEAIGIVVDAGQASISMLQRRLRIGYARAARLIDEMEVRGIVSGFEGSKPRDVFITKEEFEEKYKDI